MTNVLYGDILIFPSQSSTYIIRKCPDMVIVTGSYINVLILMCVIYFYVVYESPICKSIIIINYGSSRLPGQGNVGYGIFVGFSQFKFSD